MKFFCYSIDFADAVSKVSKALPIKKINPILEGIKISAQENILTIFASDLEFSIEIKINAEVLIEGVSVVNGRVLADFVRKLGSESIEVFSTETNMTIGYSENKVVLQCLRTEEYPPFVFLNDEGDVTVKGKDYKDIIEKVIFCTSNEDNRPILKGCSLEIRENEMRAVALNGYRLGFAQSESVITSKDTDIIIPARALHEITRLIGDEDIVSIKTQRSFLQMNFSNTSVLARLIEGKFIDYRKIIPLDFGIEVTANKKQLEEAIERAVVIMRDEKVDVIRMEISENILIITTKSELGNIKESITVNKKGNDINIGFNAKYIIDSLKAIEGDFVRLKMIESTKPCVIEPIENKNCLYLVLPLKILN